MNFNPQTSSCHWLGPWIPRVIKPPFLVDFPARHVWWHPRLPTIRIESPVLFNGATRSHAYCRARDLHGKDRWRKRHTPLSKDLAFLRFLGIFIWTSGFSVEISWKSYGFMIHSGSHRFHHRFHIMNYGLPQRFPPSNPLTKRAPIFRWYDRMDSDSARWMWVGKCMKCILQWILIPVCTNVWEHIYIYIYLSTSIYIYIYMIYILYMYISWVN